MTQTFKAGDKVVNDVFGVGEIVYGPYDGETYLYKTEDGSHRTVTASLCKPAVKFAVGDRVKSRFGTLYTVQAGPFFAPGEWYVLKADKSGNEVHSYADGVELVTSEPAKDEVLKPGDVVRIPTDCLAMADVKAGDLLVVSEVRDDNVIVHAAPGARLATWIFRTAQVERVDPATVAVVDNVVYDLAARYVDRDGDYWTFKDVDGTVRGECRGRDVDASADVDEYSDTLNDVATLFGPLTRV